MTQRPVYHQPQTQHSGTGGNPWATSPLHAANLVSVASITMTFVTL